MAFMQLIKRRSFVKPLRVLFISPYLPSLIRVRPYNLIQALAGRGHHVTLLALEPPGEDRKGFDTLHDCCARVQTVGLPRWRTMWNGLRAVPGRTPFQAAYSRSPEMAALVRRIQAEERVDVVHVEHLRGAELSRAVNGLPIVFDSVDSIALLFEQVSQSGPTWRSRLMARLDLERTRHFESHLLQRYARVLATSPRDREALVQLTDTPEADDRLVVLPNGVDLDYFSPLSLTRDPATIVFSGKMSYHANVAAALDLATQVMPHVWAQSSAARLVIAGKDPTPELLGLAADPRITVTGSVPDLRPYLAQATLAVTPMATPVVSTPQAVSAMQVEPGRDVLIAETPKRIAEAMLSLLCDAGLRQSIGQAGRRYVETYHDWSHIAEKLERVYQETIVDRELMTRIRNN
jgi:glycosyltransferase involved in cell wall biosynthesis